MRLSTGFSRETSVVLIASLAPLVLLLLFWNTLSDNVPVHWFVGAPNRWGSKYELLTLPLVSVILGLLVSIRLSGCSTLRFISSLFSEYTSKKLFLCSIGSSTAFFAIEAIWIVLASPSFGVESKDIAMQLLPCLPGIAYIVVGLCEKNIKINQFML